MKIIKIPYDISQIININHIMDIIDISDDKDQIMKITSTIIHNEYVKKHNC